MSQDTPRWKSTASYDYIDRLSAPDIGWEWLRRNEQYQHSYAEFSGAVHPDAMLTERAGARWGLRFPYPSRAHSR